MNLALIAPIIFIFLEISNVLTLYFFPGSKKANGVGVFNAWEKSKRDSEIHNFIKYLVYWVAGTKLIFLALLAAIIIYGDQRLRMVALLLMFVSIGTFYFRLFPLIRQMDREGQISPAKYSLVLGGLIAVFMLAMLLSALFV